ncbi:hypothetical protein [Flavobacterium sp.]|uniref:hypothetical protein n=1 Tax=Flavobacterium sp. TaxID=239 RepID=UPI002638F08C|nr:hypothetical protein [Flavobacterium sp.]
MNNLTKKTRYLPIIGIALTLIGYLFISFQTYSLNERKKNLLNDIAELETIKSRLTNSLKIKDTIITIQDKIIAQSSDSTIAKKEKLLKETIETHFIKVDKKEANSEQAQKFEADGFRYLLDKDVNNAISAFRKSENAYNGFHQVYEIAVYLNKNKSKLSDANSEFWKETYRKILTDFSWRMPEDVKQKLTAASN